MGDPFTFVKEVLKAPPGEDLLVVPTNIQTRFDEVPTAVVEIAGGSGFDATQSSQLSLLASLVATDRFSATALSNAPSGGGRASYDDTNLMAR